MLRFGRITIENYRTIERAEFDYSKPGLYRVVGVNHDDAGANDNGSGKSAFLEAFYWALTGAVLRDDKYEEDVCPKKRVATCRVALEFTDALERRVVVDRSRSTKGRKGGLLVSIDGQSAANQQHKKDTQAVLYDILGLDADVLRTVDVLTNNFEFLGASESKRKELLEKLLRMSVMADARERVGKERKRVQAEADALESKARVEDVKVTGAKNRIGELERQLAAFEGDRSRRLGVVRGQIAGIDKQIVDTVSKLEGIEREVANLGKRGEELAAMAPDKSPLADLVSLIADCDSVVAETRPHYIAREREIAAIDRRLAHLRGGHLAGNDCDECGKPVTNEDVAAYVARLTADRAVKARELDDFKASLDDCAVVRADADKRRADIETRAKSIDDQVQACRNAVNTRSLEAKTVKATIEGLEKQRGLLRSQATAIEAEQPVVGPLIGRERAVVAECEPELERLTAAASKARDEQRYLEWWEEGFGPAGVRSFALDAVMPLLNETAQRYLNEFSSAFTVSYSPQSTTKAGNVREKLSINVASRSGVDNLGSGSGGEQRRIAYADLFARRRLRAVRLPEPNVLIADEVFDAIDATGVEALVKVLAEEAKTKCVLVVAHNEHLAAHFQKVVRVERRGDVSRVEVV